MLAIFSPNCIDTPAITWGTHWAGGILSPANPGYTADELAFQLKDCRARAVITQKPLLSKVREACKKVGIEEHMIILMGDEKDENAKFKHFTNIRNISGATRFRRTKLDPKKDLAFLVYSSGTAGHPKGVMLSHSNIVSNNMQLQIGEGGLLKWNGGKNNDGDKILAFLPFFHIYVCPLSIPSFVAQLTQPGPNVFNPPSHLRRPNTYRHAFLLPRQILPACRNLHNHLCLCCPSHNPSIREIPHCLKLQPFLPPNAKQWSRSSHERPSGHGLSPPQSPHKARLWFK